MDSTAYDGDVVVVVDDDPAVRESIVRLCASVALTALSYTELAALEADPRMPLRGCMVLDMRLPGLGGIPAVERVRSRYPGFAVICVSEFADARTVIRALRAGVVDFFDKPFSGNELLESIQLALKHELAVPVGQAPRSAGEYRRLLNTLTRRQKDVLKLFGTGADEREIAYRLGLHLRTVQRHLRKALAALEISPDDRHLIEKLYR